MLKESKVKEAFAKTKKSINGLILDLSVLKNRVDRHESALKINDDLKVEIDYLKKVDLNKFTRKLENEIDNINLFISDMNKRSQEVSRIINGFDKKLENTGELSNEMEGKFVELRGKVEYELGSIDDLTKRMNTIEDAIEVLRKSQGGVELKDQITEFEMLLDEKITLEVSSFKLETDSNFARIASDLSKVSEKFENSNGKNSIDIEKIIDSKLKDFKKELLGDMKKVQKEEKKVTSKKITKKSVSTKKSNAKSQGGEKLKKAVKWLFVDDVEDDEMSTMEDVKNSASVSKKKAKN